MQQVIKFWVQDMTCNSQVKQTKVTNINFTATINQHKQVIMLCSFMVNMHNPNNKADFFDRKNTLS